MIRVVLADDQALVRSGLRALLANSDDLQVVGDASDGREAVAVVTRTQPDVVLMDALGARDRAQLVVIAYESGLVTPGRHLETPGRP